MKSNNELVNEIGRFNNKYCKNTKNRLCLSEENGKYVKVSKIRGYNDNEKNKDRLYELDIKKYPLTKRSGVDNFVYSRRNDNRKFLNLKDGQIFDKEPVFKLSSRDTHKVVLHTFKNKKGRR